MFECKFVKIENLKRNERLVWEEKEAGRECQLLNNQFEKMC